MPWSGMTKVFLSLPESTGRAAERGPGSWSETAVSRAIATSVLVSCAVARSVLVLTCEGDG